MTKKQIRARNAAWKLALAEGRVLRHVVGTYPERVTLTSYATIIERDAVLARAGGYAQIVEVNLRQI